MRLFRKSLHAALMGIMLFVYSVPAFGFVISDVRVEGLQRISPGTVFGAIPFNVGDDVDELDLRLIIRSLFKTESFDDVQVGRDGNVLVARRRPLAPAPRARGSPPAAGAAPG